MNLSQLRWLLAVNPLVRTTDADGNPAQLSELVHELEFRSYARRSGEHACPADHGSFAGRCGQCGAQV